MHGPGYLYTNNGHIDNILYASKLLHQRINDLIFAGALKLSEVEKTHNVYVNGHFRPFVATAFEYEKVTIKNAQFDSTVEFPIPAFGDFLHDMVCRFRLPEIRAKTGTLAEGAVFGASGSVSGSVYNANGPYTEKTFRNMVRYCEFPGNRIFTNVSFIISGNVIDSYSEYVPVMLEKFTVHPAKRDGYNRLVGQQNIHSGIMDRSCKFNQYFNGPQVPKLTQPALDVWHKLKFWFNDDVRSAIPTFALPIGQRSIVMRTAPMSKILYEVPSLYITSCAIKPHDEAQIAHILGELKSVNINFSGRGAEGINAKIADLMMSISAYECAADKLLHLQGIMNTAIACSAALHCGTLGSTFPLHSAGKTGTVTSKLSSLATTISSLLHLLRRADAATMPALYTPLEQYNGLEPTGDIVAELYINNIFINPEVYDIFVKRASFSLIRVYREFVKTIDSVNSVTLNTLKYPVEYMFIGIQPAQNQSDDNPNQWRDWHRMTHQTTDESNKYHIDIPTAESLRLTSDGMPVLINGAPHTFHNSYIPYHYGNDIITPNDMGCFFINMALFPRDYQPSGHINASQREIKLDFELVQNDTKHKIIITTVCINFLMISKECIKLRYID